MCKKLCLAVGAVIVGLAVITFTGLGTLAKVKWDDMQNYLEKKVPPETQLKQIHVEIGNIDKDIKQHLGKLAAQEVEVERLETNLAAMKDQQLKLREDIAAMTKALDTKSENTNYTYNGKKYRQSELALKLESSVGTYEVRKSEIKTKDQLLTQKRQSLEASHQRISDMRAQKDKLRVAAADLERRIEILKMKQVNSPVDVDDTQVNKVNGMVEKLDKQLAEKEKEAELYAKYGYTVNDKGHLVRETKSTEQVIDAAKKALQDDEEKVVDQKKAN